MKSLSFTTTWILCLAMAPGISAQDNAAQIDKIFSWTKPDTPGCVCAVSQHGKTVFSKAYGLADLERKVPLTENSVFDIGSVHKQFVAASVLLLAADKKLSLNDEVRKYIPELPDYGRNPTINQLLTHTSGVRDWTGLQPLAGGNTDALTLILRQQGLNFAPGESWSYSNSGYVLLKEIVSQVSGMPFGAFAAKRLFEPLGMKATRYSYDMLDVIPDRAIAYEQEKDGLKVAMRTGNMRGGGGVLSAAGDLLLWNKALTEGKLGSFVTEKLIEPARLNNGRQLVYARGMAVDPYRGGVRMWAHSGGSSGYSTWLGRFPDYGLSIAVLCNVEPISASNFALRIADLYLPDTLRELEGDGQPPPIPSDMDLSGKTGLYYNEADGSMIRLAIDRGRFRIAGGPGLEVISPNRFRRWGTGIQYRAQEVFEIIFPSEEVFELKSTEGNSERYRKVSPYTYPESALGELAGVYNSAELGTEFHLEPGKNALMVTLGHDKSRKLRFEPISKDLFHWNARMQLRILRDTSGAVTGFMYRNPAVTNIRFERKVD